MTAQDAITITQGVAGLFKACLDYFIQLLDATGMTAVYIALVGMLFAVVYLLGDILVDAAGSDVADAEKQLRRKGKKG